jgi:hypothetical protein
MHFDLLSVPQLEPSGLPWCIGIRGSWGRVAFAVVSTNYYQENGTDQLDQRLLEPASRVDPAKPSSAVTIVEGLAALPAFEVIPTVDRARATVGASLVDQEAITRRAGQARWWWIGAKCNPGGACHGHGGWIL